MTVNVTEEAIVKHLALYPQIGPDGLSAHRARISSEQHIDCLLYRQGNRVVGVLAYYPMDVGGAGEREGDLRLFVHPDHQGQGIGRALWDEAEARWSPDPTKQNMSEAALGFARHIRPDLPL